MRDSVFSLGKEAKGSKSPSSERLLFVNMSDSKLGRYCSKLSPILLETFIDNFIHKHKHYTDENRYKFTKNNLHYPVVV